MKPTVFIQSNARQRLGAIVGQHALRRNSRDPEAFEVTILRQEDHEFFRKREGQPFLRDGIRRIWENDDLQSFTPLRFMPPEKMGYEGRAIVIDPDVFAVGDVLELFERDMGGHAVLCRRPKGRKARIGGWATSVMLLDCARLRHWHCETQFAELFAFERDYMQWVLLQTEPEGSVGPLDPCWNDFDRLTDETRMLHNTKRWTQPWKTGLPVDFTPAERTRAFPPLGWMRRARRALLGSHGGAGRYRRHPDPRQERFFFGLLRECLDEGGVDEVLLRTEIAAQHLRADAFELLERAEPPPRRGLS